MSNPQQDQDQYGRRKSKRQRVPNPYYTAGINELKKITLKNQSKKNKNDDDDDYSSEEEKNISQNNRVANETYQTNTKYDNSSSWLSCIMPKSNKKLKVQIVLDSNTRLMQPQSMRMREEPPAKPSFLSQFQNVSIPSYSTSQAQKKAEPQGGLNLLSLFQKVIKNVSDEVPSPVKNPSINNNYSQNNNIEEPIIKYPTSMTQKAAKQQQTLPPQPKRVLQEDKDGRITSLEIDKQNKVILIKHSKLGECSVPIQVTPPCWKMEEQKTEQQIEMMNELRKRLASNSAFLKNIAIYN